MPHDGEHQQRVDLGVVEPAGDAWRSASVPGSAAAWPANADTPPSSWRSAKSSTPPSAKTGSGPRGTRVGPSTTMVPIEPTMPRAAGAVAVRLELAGDDDDARPASATRPPMASDGLHEVAAPARNEGLDQHAEAGHAEDHEQRRRGGRTRWWA